jgi:hypothetical protein
MSKVRELRLWMLCVIIDDLRHPGIDDDMFGFIMERNVMGSGFCFWGTSNDSQPSLLLEVSPCCTPCFSPVNFRLFAAIYTPTTDYYGIKPRL